MSLMATGHSSTVSLSWTCPLTPPTLPGETWYVAVNVLLPYATNSDLLCCLVFRSWGAWRGGAGRGAAGREQESTLHASNKAQV